MKHDYKYLVDREARRKERLFNLAGALLVAGVLICAWGIENLIIIGEAN